MSCIGGPSIESFWDFCKERENIRLKKEAGEPRPWTSCHVLNTFHFCSLRREHDGGTQWYLKRVAPECQDFGDLLFRTVLYRCVNNVKWWENLGGEYYGKVISLADWQFGEHSIRKVIQDAPAPYSYAYIVLQGPDGRDRKAHLIELLEIMGENLDYYVKRIQEATSLKAVWRRLQDLPYVGPFVALQVYRDLLLVKALPFDDNDFTYLGPGAIMGLEMLGVDGSYPQQYDFVLKLRDNQPDWLQPPLTLGDCEHALCESRKFWRLSEGKGRHRYYKAI